METGHIHDTGISSEILKRQKEFFRTGGTLPVRYRLECLKRLRETIVSSESEILGALKEDLGKSATEAYMTEVGMALSELSCAIRNLRKWSRTRRTSTPLAQFPARSFIIPEPYGNVLIMSPWNYPFLLCISPLASALAAGNTAVVKPSAYSPASSAIIRRIVEKALPQETAAVVEGGRDVNSGLLEQDFDYIFFTGSKTVGRLVMEKAAVRLTPVTLELGGKSPVIVDPSADIRVAAARIVFGKYLNCGQTCVAPDYVIVHESIRDSFIAACKREILGMYGLDILQNPEYGKIINRKHFDRLCGIMDEIRGKCVFGGSANAENLRIEPSVYSLGSISAPETDSLKIMQEEIFGPLMPVLTYRETEEAVGYIDRHPRPLATYIFTSDRKTAKKLLDRLHFGGGCVNDTIIHLASENLPFGGLGESGMGHYHGKYGFETFSHLKSIVDKPYWLDLPMRYQPFTGLKDRLIRMFLK